MTNQKYYTVGPPTAGHKRNFTLRDGHVWVFRSYDSAVKYRDIYENGLSINNWETLTELAAQVQERHQVVPLISLEPEVDAGAEFQSVSVDDILKKDCKLQ